MEPDDRARWHFYGNTVFVSYPARQLELALLRALKVVMLKNIPFNVSTPSRSNQNACRVMLILYTLLPPVNFALIQGFVGHCV